MWPSIALLVAVAVAASPCPQATGEPKDIVELKGRAPEPAECLRTAMEAELDKVIVPLKASSPDKYKRWMKAQADYNGWAKDVCALAETLFWVDFDKRVKGTGTAI